MTFDISKINIPSNPGIYLMKDSHEKIIYIGKAKNLKNRIRSYFLKNQNYKTQKLVENISDIEFVLTDNESEAFLLESNMIKKHRPKFNIELKDQQRYTYLRISRVEAITGAANNAPGMPATLAPTKTPTITTRGGNSTASPNTRGTIKLFSVICITQ